MVSLDLKVQASIAMAMLMIASVVSGATLSMWGDGAPVACDESPLPPMDDRSVLFMGPATGSSPILDRVSDATSRITRSDSLPALGAAGAGNSMVLIDGQWAGKADRGEVVIVLRSLIAAGVPVVIINGDADLIREAVEGDPHIGYMISVSSNPLHSSGIHYDAERHSGASYAYSSIDGDLALAGLDAYTWCAQFLDD